MIAPRQKFSSHASPELLVALRDIARREGRPFQAVLEDALKQYIENYAGQRPRASVKAHFEASVERNRRLGELLAE